MNTHARLSLRGVLCLVLVSAQSCTQGQPWEEYNEAGVEALDQGRYAEAESQFIAACKEAEKSGPEDTYLATSLNNLAGLYRTQGKYTEAEPLFQRSLAIVEKALGPEHLNVAQNLENYAALLRKMGRENEAAEMEARAQAIRAKQSP